MINNVSLVTRIDMALKQLKRIVDALENISGDRDNEA